MAALRRLDVATRQVIEAAKALSCDFRIS